MASQRDIHLHGESLTIVKRCGAPLCEILDTKFGCVATIVGVQQENESSTPYLRRPPTVPPQKRLEIMMPSGVKVSVVKADLTNFQADAVVNAANKELKHIGGLARALSTAGGPKIQKESEDYVKKYGKLKTGEAVVFDAGLLPCKKIIHAVGPELPYYPTKNNVLQAEPLLKKTIWSILDIVEKHGLVNVAIPAISSGLFNYPLPECAHTIVSAVKEYYMRLSPIRPVAQEIFLVNHDDPTVQAIENACHQIFHPQQHQSYSQAAAKNTRSTDPQNPPPSVQIGNVVLKLKKGNIEEQKTDVIVNTASKNKDLSKGKISSAILDKAGFQMQHEIWNDNSRGCIVNTRPYRLHCKEVFHTFCTEKRLDPAADHILYNSVLECLKRAAAQHYTSISFPAIGTGALGFSKDESATIMLQAVFDFSLNFQNKMEVYLVIFPSDHETFQAFLKKMGHFQQGSASSSSSLEVSGGGGKFSHHSHQQQSPGHSWGSQGHTRPEASWDKADSPTSRAQTPKISLLGPSDESTKEAEKWLTDLLSMHSHTVKIYNNFILHFSEEDHLRLSVVAENELIEEFFTQGHACIEINGETKEDTVFAALEVEAMLCKIQKDFISEEEGDLQMMSQTDKSCKRETVEKSSKVFLDRSDAFSFHGLRVMKVEKIENNPLKLMFDMKKKQLGISSSKIMFQCIPAQFCEMISRIGFQAECAPPEDQRYGEGIYFASTIKKALDLWKNRREEYLYFVEAEVLKGKSVPGKPELIMPPAVDRDPSIVYDSVDGGPDISVIFSGYQALPKYIIICKKEGKGSGLLV
ncbi:PREDICTED: poly [ADP-ribose] polymerase 9-like [Cyprinodon variegatus]|uniref:Poly [ADP-ribose] polymerase 9-like n=1 Tax=Cyprinodon variegatus TaxID=28743 RepID=A0A3Q2DZE9_CYPVA|nr:PREDICTED: poly [ADP-ribose] polymerase 9-like [Cyprinodon variegatus]